MFRLVVFFAVLSAVFSPYAIAQDSTVAEPILTGYVTRGITPTDFDVNGWSIRSDSNTAFTQSTGTSAMGRRESGGKVFVGERVSIFGKKNLKQHLVQAREVVFLRLETETRSGLAVVDHMFPSDNRDALKLRADGYVMTIDKSTRLDSSSEIKLPADVHTGDWIGYEGSLGPSGILITSKVMFYKSRISIKEGKLIEKTNYDPSSISDDTKQSFVSKSLLGINPKLIPPHHDAALQSRVERIGERLIPAYQRTLDDQHPLKVHFRFQLVDDETWKSGFALPSGIVLVPFQIAERLHDDSQLATIIADSIAMIIEKQPYRLLPASTALTVVSVASLAGGFFVPGLELGSTAAGIASHKIGVDLLNQSGRVSLCLLHDGGFDIMQAPIAWWTLDLKPQKTFTNTSPPARSTYLYKTIGRVWNAYPEPTPPPLLDASPSHN